MGAEAYSIELISIETYAPQFIGHNKNFLGSVIFDLCSDQICMYLNLDAQPEIQILNWLKWTDSIVKPKSVNKNIAEFQGHLFCFKWFQPTQIRLQYPLVLTIAIRVMEFSSGGYKIRKIFA
jgi:hypothetical protein